MISLRAQVKDVNGKYTPIKIPVVTTNNGGFPTGTVNTSGTTAWTPINGNVTGNWNFRMRAQIPAGYHALSEHCERNKWDGKAPIRVEQHTVNLCYERMQHQ